MQTLWLMAYYSLHRKVHPRVQAVSSLLTQLLHSARLYIYILLVHRLD